MREHMGIFRGKRIDNGEWVMGYYVRLHDHKGNVSHRIYSGCAETDCGDFYPDWFEVDPDTIGECTGLGDKNGKLIFEGDLLRFGGKIGYVVYGNGCFSVQHIDSINRPAIDIVMLRGVVKIIGNIHDNPELLKGGE